MAMTKSISFLRAIYPSLLARIVYQVGSPAMFEGKRFFAGDRDAHLKNAAKKHGVRTLRTRTVHGRNLNTHIVDDAFWLPLP